MPAISVIVPSFNQGHLIGHTIDSILSQGVDVDVFVADGGSKDATVEVLKRYGDRIGWVSEKDRGQTHAINKGLERARGEIVAYINSDDTYEPGVLKRALQAFDAHPDIGLVYGDANFIDEKGALLERTHAVDFDLGVLTWDHNYICQPASFWRRSVVERIGPFDESLYYYMDYEWFLRAAHAGVAFLHVREPWANLRLHASCKTVSGSVGAHEKMRRERAAILAKYQRLAGPAWADAAVRRTLKLAYRGKKLAKDLFENRKLPLASHRARMERVGNAG